MIETLTLLLVACSTAQDPPTPPVTPPAVAAPGPTATAADQPELPLDLQELAMQVETAHRPKGPVPPITAIRSDLKLHLLDPAAEQRGEVELTMQYLAWTPPGKTKARSLLRYEMLQEGKPIVRGVDRFGPWQLSQGEPQDITATQDLEQCDRQTNLTKQLLRFLSPGEVLRSLERPSAVRDEVLKVDRTRSVPCRVVDGDLATFPLLQRGGEDAPARLRIHVDRERGVLLAVDAWPLLDGKPDPARQERIVLVDLQERDGLLVPHELRWLFLDERGVLRQNSKAVLTTLQLRPELSVTAFDRKKAAPR
jgi:hypothetical protein